MFTNWWFFFNPRDLWINCIFVFYIWELLNINHFVRLWVFLTSSVYSSFEEVWMRASNLLVARPTAQPYLIFVTYITYEICGEKFVIWRNFRFLFVINVEKSEISPHVACVWWGECLHMCEIHAFFVVKLVLLQFTHLCCKFVLSRFTRFRV